MCEASCLDLDFCLVRFQLSVECLFSLHMALIGRCSCDDGVSRGLSGFHWLCAFTSPCFARTWLYVCVSMHHVFLVCRSTLPLTRWCYYLILVHLPHLFFLVYSACVLHERTCS